ncbi:MAG: COG4280 domain-containing protein [Candidatus Limnocylindrales bacterium]
MELLLAAVPAFLASIVEAVEALTIVLAVGVTRQWRSTLYGAFSGLAVLAVVVAIFGTAIVLYVPLGALRIVIGSLLLIYGLQWTCKAILRGAGAIKKHDEERIYAEEVGRLKQEAPVPATGLDGVSFAVAFKGVLLEGLEVAFIVITFGSGSAGRLLSAGVGAALACGLVLVVGIFVHRPLSRVPENGLKYAVGIMLITFGTFWAGEGVGVEWPASDATLIAIGIGYAILGVAAIWLTRQVLEGRRGRRVPAEMA